MIRLLTKQSPKHVGECEDQQGAAAKGVDGVDGRPGEHEVDETEAEARPQGRVVADAALPENCGAVEGDDVDTAHLLGLFLYVLS